MSTQLRDEHRHASAHTLVTRHTYAEPCDLKCPVLTKIVFTNPKASPMTMLPAKMPMNMPMAARATWAIAFIRNLLFHSRSKVKE